MADVLGGTAWKHQTVKFVHILTKLHGDEHETVFEWTQTLSIKIIFKERGVY